MGCWPISKKKEPAASVQLEPLLINLVLQPAQSVARPLSWRFLVGATPALLLQDCTREHFLARPNLRRHRLLVSIFVLRFRNKQRAHNKSVAGFHAKIIIMENKSPSRLFCLRAARKLQPRELRGRTRTQVTCNKSPQRSTSFLGVEI